MHLVFAQDWGFSEPVRLPAHSMSDGTLRMLGILTAVFQPARPTVIVLEEPESTMHPGALGAIVDVIAFASRSMQVVVATHSPEILDADWIESDNLRLLTWENGATLVHPISDECRYVLQNGPMGAGELLRSNALSPAPLKVVGKEAPPALFEDPPL